MRGYSRNFAAILFALAAATAAPAVADTYKLATLDRENDVLSEPIRWWMQNIAERTAQRVQIQPFWAESLVPIARTMSAVESGIADFGHFVTLVLAGHEKDFAILRVPGSIPTDGPQFIKAWEAIRPAMTRIMDRHGIVPLWPRPPAKVPLACKTKLLTQASDYKDLKVRAAGRWQIEA